MRMRGVLEIVPGAKAVVMLTQFADMSRGHRSATPRSAIDPPIMHTYQRAIGGQPNITLQRIRTIVDCL